MRVAEQGDGWSVVDDHGDVLAGPFETNASAWRWIDRNDARDVDTENRRLGTTGARDSGYSPGRSSPWRPWAC